MSIPPESTPALPTAPSRPSTLTLLMLAAVVVGFFVVVFTYKEEPHPGAPTAPVAAPQE